MVKNTTGGKKAKQGCHKTFTSTKTVLSSSPFEIYGIVVKMMGGKICEVKCDDQETRLCHIRGAFSGKNKSANFLRPGQWVLVGLREWSSSKNHCDLLCIYTDRDKEKIQQTRSMEVLQTEEHRMLEIDPEADLNIEEVNFDDI